MDHPIPEFKETVWAYYHQHGRALPWRQPGSSPYAIMVSEIMLQQTQVPRVIPKYELFMTRFPTIESLAAAQFHEVLSAWDGLGYNRRAKFLHEAAKMVVDTYGGSVPRQVDALTALPGVGKNTAAAIAVYAYDQPQVFIETNIRTVFIYHFFGDAASVADADLQPIIEAALDREHPREWYWALMDYGSHLKTTIGNVSRLSAHYKKQSTFKGSRRQLRAQVLKALLLGSANRRQLRQSHDDERLDSVLVDLEKEGLIRSQNNLFMLT